jgi:ATP-dependent helicase/nuclease subunit A
MQEPPQNKDFAAREIFQHTAISASAGTGKTYALAHRYIALVQRGVPPDRICALTFSRKAAGEIFDEIIRHLCDGARLPERARLSAREIGAPLQPADFAAALRRVVDHLHRLHIGTIDSFVVGVVRAFPFELGIAPDFRIGDSEGAAGDEVRRTLFGRLFDPGLMPAPTRQAFLAAFKLATFGQEQKSLGQSLERFVSELTAIHRRIPAPQAWGDAHTIWGRALPWPRLPADRRAALAAAASQVAWPDAAAAQYIELVAFLRDYDDQREWPSRMESRTLFPRLWQVLAAPAGQPFAVKFGKQELLLPPPAADALRPLAGHAMAVELDRALHQTRGVEALLALYETLYSEHVRRSGQLGFDDLARLVAGDAGMLPSRRARQPDRLFIDYRLDASLDHWLLDEFQDTSDLQWRVLGNLIDETVQDDSGTRSFFCVGDVKQAIYGWRGGNHRLFGRVTDYYGDGIATVDRNVSFRSAPAVIEAVNRVFGSLSEDDHLAPPTLAEWAKVWRTHEAARRDLPGAVELLEAVPGRDEDAADARYRAVATRLAAIDPVARGLQAAVLLRTNDQARRCADVLRQHLPQMPVALEGKASLLDNPLVPLLLSLVRAAAHAGDTLAWRHVEMSPLAGELAKPPSGQPANGLSDSARSWLSLALLSQLHNDGFQATLRDWCARLAATQPFDAFTRQRRDDLLDAAAAFDATGDRDCDRFVRFIEGYTRHDTAAETAVRVMTIHQSKGLGFDLVCVPFDPDGESFDNPGRGEMLEDARGAWVLRAPRQLVVASDGILRAAAEHQLSDAAFAKLCVFYVALTRAKQGLILVVSPPPAKGTVVREDTLLRRRFAGGAAPEDAEAGRPASPAAPLRPPPSILHRSGDAAWHTHHAPRAAAAVAPAPAPQPLAPGAARLKRVEPSKHDPGTRPARTLFLRESGDVRVFGSAIHRLFQQIEWLETFDTEAAIAAWRAAATEPAAVLHDVERQFRASLAAPEVRQALRRPAGDVTLWREKPFELLLDGELLAGQFDRVVVRRAAAGHVEQVCLFDYKSNRVEGDALLRAAAAQYREQMRLYTLALHRLLGPAPVTAQLVFTRVGRVVTLRDDA